MKPADHHAEAERLLSAAAARTTQAAAKTDPLHTAQILRDRTLTEHDLRAALVHAVLATTTGS